MKRNHIPRLLVLLSAMLLLPNIPAVRAADYNPFFGAAINTEPAKKAVKQPPAMPPLPAPIAPSAAMMPMVEQTPVSQWRVAGKIGDMVTLVKNDTERSIIPNGTEKDECLVLYPDIICGRKQKEAVQQRLNDEQQKKLAGQQNLARQKQQIEELTATVNGLRTNLEEANSTNKKLADEMKTAPSWVKGNPKEYDDVCLGHVKVSRTAGDIFFQVAMGQEQSADKFFGAKYILQKEKKGDFVYYALNAKNVKVRE
jgi:hypothetical protein